MARRRSSSRHPQHAAGEGQRLRSVGDLDGLGDHARPGSISATVFSPASAVHTRARTHGQLAGEPTDRHERIRVAGGRVDAPHRAAPGCSRPTRLLPSNIDAARTMTHRYRSARRRRSIASMRYDRSAPTVGDPDRSRTSPSIPAGLAPAAIVSSTVSADRVELRNGPVQRVRDPHEALSERDRAGSVPDGDRLARSCRPPCRSWRRSSSRRSSPRSRRLRTRCPWDRLPTGIRSTTASVSRIDRAPLRCSQEVLPRPRRLRRRSRSGMSPRPPGR